MIVRNARRESLDYGPTPGFSHVPISGSIARPGPTPKSPAHDPEYKRQYRARIKQDAERYARDLERERARNARRYAAGRNAA